MEIIEVTEKGVKAAFGVAKSDEVKKVLAALFCKPENKPNRDDYKSIKTYEDACEALKTDPIIFGNNDPFIGELFEDCEDLGMKKADLPNHIIALIKLETISHALWGRTFQPKPDAKGSECYYSPRFSLCTKKEIKDMSDDYKGAFMSVDTHDGESTGFGCLIATPYSSYECAPFGFRLCQETEEKALYFGKQFAELWADYIAYYLAVGERIKK